jgi:hypothetical protein
MLYGLPDAIRAAGFSPVPDPDDIAKAIQIGLMPWIDQRDGRWGFNESDIPRIAAALGLKSPEPDPNATPSPLDALSNKFSELIKQDDKHG